MFKRKIYDNIYSKLFIDNKAIILIWARQVWKTTIMKSLLWNNKYSTFIDLDLFSNREIFDSEETLLFYIKTKWYIENSKETFYLFIDEFQNVANSTIILKGIIDNIDNIKIIASWSSSLKIKNLLKESLVWRAYIFNIFPLDFEEFLIFKNQEELLWILNSDNIPEFYIKKINILLKEFLIYGWYPEVVLKNTKEEKFEILENIFQFYLQKDIRDLLWIRNIRAYSNMLRYIALNIWQLLKINSMSNDIWITNITSNNYISILEDTFLIWLIEPYFSNKINSIKKTPKVFMLDNWMRNYILKNFWEFDLRTDKWALVENYVYSEFLKNKPKISNLFYFRDKNHNEIDFILEKDNRLDLFEVKINNISKVNKNAFKILEKLEINSENILSFKVKNDIKYNYKYLFNIFD